MTASEEAQALGGQPLPGGDGDGAAAAVAAHDLTQTISSYLDLHLIFPLLDFIEQKELYQVSDVAQARLVLLEPTNMVDYAIEVYENLHGQEPPGPLKSRREEVYARLGKLKEASAALTEIVEDVALVEQLVSEGRFTLEGLKAHSPQMSEAALEAFADYAKFNYDCGDYASAGQALGTYLQITGGAGTTARGPSCLWGRLACEILNNNSDGAMPLIQQVKQMNENRPISALQQLQQRSWLLHWSLFVFFNHANGREELISLFFEEKYLQAIQTNCPWLLRYLVTAVILTTKSAATNRRKHVMKDLIRVLEQEKNSYSDPITEFLECLYVNFDFDGAMQRRAECEKVLLSDFFLCNVCDEFMEAARLFIFETYCRIHHKIDIAMLAAKMGMDEEEAEKWIVDLIRGSQLDAKIDSRDNHVIMGGNFPSVYEQVVEKTKDLNVRSYLLIHNLKTHLSGGQEGGESNGGGHHHQRMDSRGGDRGGGRGRGNRGQHSYRDNRD